MTDYSGCVRSALREVHIYGSFAYSWFGVRFPPIAAPLRQKLSRPALHGWLVSELSTLFYTNFYTTGVPTPLDTATAPRLRVAGRDFLYQLEKANVSNGYYEEGWQVQAVRGQELVLRGHGVSVCASFRECRLPENTSPVPGDSISLRSPQALRQASPGYYLILGDEPLSRDSQDTIVRLYWNLRPGGAPELVSSITRNLRGTGIPYRLKVLSDPASYTRCDAGVMYVRHRDYHRVVPIAEKVHVAIMHELKGQAPAFTKRLAWGLGYAEEPISGESFGRSRARLMAEALVESHASGHRDADNHLGAVRARFSRDGIDLERPYLGPASPGGEPSLLGELRPPDPAISVSAPAAIPPDKSLSMAGLIGSRLMREAFWHSGECNWLSDVQYPGSAPGGGTPAYAFLGPDLYSGTSGISLFLAELSLACSSLQARNTALGAIRHALRRSLEGGIGPAGLYNGQIGVAMAAARIGRILNEDEPVQLARELAGAALASARDIPADDTCEFDIIGGDAGSVIALLALHDVLGHDMAIEAANWHGARLMAGARHSARGCSWKSPKHVYPNDLTGLAHGAAGAALALLELYRATGDSSALQVALQAIAYEDSWFDMESGNWPDFRGNSWRRRDKSRSGDFACFWCHGAPGILLARLHALEITGDIRMKYHIKRALETTQAMLSAALQTGDSSFSLCHGLAGNADIVMLGSDYLQDDFAASDYPNMVGRAGVERALSNRLLGAGSGVEAPGLMHGMAGTGYFYLRLHEQSIPSVLFPVTPAGCRK